MIKERLFDSFTKYLLYNNNEVHEKLEKFFDSNVVTPIGENRIPCADILHQWLEGAEIEWYDPFSSKWVPQNGMLNLSLNLEYRIKQKDPVYEWQFVCLQGDGKNYLTEFYTDKEVGHSFATFIKIEETKRERK
jgi:hypothetical protein